MLSISGYSSGPFTFNLPGVELLWHCKQRHSTANDQSSPNNRFPVPLSRLFACFAGNLFFFPLASFAGRSQTTEVHQATLSLFPFRVLSRVSRAILFFFPLAYFAGRSPTTEVHQGTLSRLFACFAGNLFFFPLASFAGRSPTTEVHQATLSLFPFRVLSRVSRAIILSFPHASFSGH
jgi:predicted membrane protein